MGCAQSVGEGEERSKRIDDEIKKEAKSIAATVKILLLGAGQTGKTTFMKQIQHLYTDGFGQEKMRIFKRIIMSNVIDYAETLATQMEAKGECKEEAEQLRPVLARAERGGDVFDQNLGEALIKFWKKPHVVEFYKRNWLQNDSCRYFFDRLPAITKKNYEPSNEDIFRCRVKTTGIYELKFTHTDASRRKVTYILTDVGGQRSERNKWIHCFENVMAVIFFVDLNGFNMTLDEAPTYNRMDESLKLFDSICNSQWFKNTSIILFFNKVDLFKEKLQSIQFADHVSGYNGDNTFESTTGFLKQKFLSLNKLTPNKPIYLHYTCATDSKNMKFVFTAVADVIIRNSLKASGLL